MTRTYSPVLVQHDRECGRHSNIPECCIEYFVAIWWPIVLLSNAESAAFIRARVARIRETERQLGVKFGHTPCEACLVTGRVVKVARCPPDCLRSILRKQQGP